MKILVVYYSMYGHIFKMAQAVAEGAGRCRAPRSSCGGWKICLSTSTSSRRVPHARATLERQKDIPIVTLEDLKTADGILFGTPTRFGNMTSQMKALFDQLVELWLQGTLEGKPAGIFTSTATTHGGQETTGFTMMAPLLHLGMLIVGVPYSTPGMLHTEGRGGTPYAASTVAGPRNELSPTPEDLEIARALGARVARIAGKLSA